MEARRVAQLVFGIAVALSSVVFGCNGAKKEEPAAAPPAGSTAAACAVSPPEVGWKRGRALAADLKTALALGDDQLCNELGSKPCVDVHRVLYGGSDPFGSGLYEPFTEPLATTSLATERLVLNACMSRVLLDGAAEKPVVFAAIDLKSPALPPSTDPNMRAVVVELYHRLLAREPSDDEVAIVLELASTGEAAVDPKKFATLACFSIGSTNEFLFF